jgi:uncharacterized protein (TIGR03790 family)
MNSIALLPEPKQDKNGLRQSQVLIQQAQKAGKEAIKRIESMRAGKERDGLFFKWLDCYEKLYGKASSLKAVSQHSWLSRPLTTEEQQLQLESLQGHVLLINSAEQEKWPLAKRLQKGFYGSLEKTSGQAGLTSYLQTQIDRLAGRESLAAVDSELSMVLYEDYELCQWQPNELKDRVFMMGSKTMMVSRLDGPSAQIAKGLVDKSMTAEKNGVKGKAYFDQRLAPDTKEQYWMALYDNSVAEAAETVKNRTGWKTELESTPALFKEGQCPDTALYCGWYSLRKYIPSFTFVTGAIGYHIASFEAIHIRDANNSEWCANLLKNGITATLGPVAEPYLHAFPEPKAFFSELLDGSCLVEAYYRTLPFNSWQIMLIGDPLYTFKIKE